MPSSTDLTARLRAWTYRRQLLDGGAADPLDALRRLVVAYSSHPSAPLTLLARVPALTPDGFAGLEGRRDAIRIPAVRLAISLVPTAFAPRVFAATRQPVEKFARNLDWAKITPADYAALKRRALEIARAPVGAKDLQAALATGDTAESKPMTAVRVMAYEGQMLRLGGGLRADTLRYVATDAWLGEPLAEEDPAASLAWLADAYLRAYGPARPADFAWWAGVTRTRAKAALTGVRTVDIGDGLLLPTDQESAFAASEPLAPDALALLPKWDSYAMGLAPDGRDRLVPTAHLKRAYSTAGSGTGATSGDGLPLVLRGGEAVAAWSHRFSGNKLRIEVNPFAPEAGLPDGIEDGFEEVGRILSASSVEVTDRRLQPTS